MRETNFNEILCMSVNAREKLWRIAEEYGREPKIYLHWTSGRYDSLFEQYHINITGEGTLYVATDDFADVLEHTWRRNSGAADTSVDNDLVLYTLDTSTGVLTEVARFQNGPATYELLSYVGGACIYLFCVAAYAGDTANVQQIGTIVR